MIELNTSVTKEMEGVYKAEGNIEGALEDGLNLLHSPERMEAWLMEEHINIHKVQAIVWVLLNTGSGHAQELSIRLCGHGLKAAVSITLVKMKMGAELPDEREYIENLMACWEYEPTQIANNIIPN